jgi:hypothetical protein
MSPADPQGMAVKRTTPSMGRILALLAGTAGLGFGSTAVAQQHERELLERPIRVSVAQRPTAPAATPRVPKPTPHRSLVAVRLPKPQHSAAGAKLHRQSPASSAVHTPAATVAPAPASAAASAPAPATQPPAQVATPALQPPAQPPAPTATPAPSAVVSGGS